MTYRDPWDPEISYEISKITWRLRIMTGAAALVGALLLVSTYYYSCTTPVPVPDNIEERHSLTIRQDRDLCIRACNGAASASTLVSSTCRWGANGRRHCECSCGSGNSWIFELFAVEIEETR